MNAMSLLSQNSLQKKHFREKKQLFLELLLSVGQTRSLTGSFQTFLKNFHRLVPDPNPMDNPNPWSYQITPGERGALGGGGPCGGRRAVRYIAQWSRRVTWRDGGVKDSYCFVLVFVFVTFFIVSLCWELVPWVKHTVLWRRLSITYNMRRLVCFVNMWLINGVMDR